MSKKSKNKIPWVLTHTGNFSYSGGVETKHAIKGNAAMKYALYIKYNYTGPYVLVSIAWDTLSDAVRDFEERKTNLEFGHMIVCYNELDILPEQR